MDCCPHAAAEDTHSFRESQRANASLKRPQTDNLQSGQTDAVPDTDMRLQSLDTGMDTLATNHNYS